MGVFQKMAAFGLEQVVARKLGPYPERALLTYVGADAASWLVGGAFIDPNRRLLNVGVFPERDKPTRSGHSRYYFYTEMLLVGGTAQSGGTSAQLIFPEYLVGDGRDEKMVSVMLPCGGVTLTLGSLTVCAPAKDVPFGIVLPASMLPQLVVYFPEPYMGVYGWLQDGHPGLSFNDSLYDLPEGILDDRVVVTNESNAGPGRYVNHPVGAHVGAVSHGVNGMHSVLSANTTYLAVSNLVFRSAEVKHVCVAMRVDKVNDPMMVVVDSADDQVVLATVKDDTVVAAPMTVLGPVGCAKL